MEIFKMAKNKTKKAEKKEEYKKIYEQALMSHFNESEPMKKVKNLGSLNTIHRTKKINVMKEGYVPLKAGTCVMLDCMLIPEIDVLKTNDVKFIDERKDHAHQWHGDRNKPRLHPCIIIQELDDSVIVGTAKTINPNRMKPITVKDKHEHEKIVEKFIAPNEYSIQLYQPGPPLDEREHRKQSIDISFVTKIPKAVLYNSENLRLMSKDDKFVMSDWQVNEIIKRVQYAQEKGNLFVYDQFNTAHIDWNTIMGENTVQEIQRQKHEWEEKIETGKAKARDDWNDAFKNAENYASKKTEETLSSGKKKKYAHNSTENINKEQIKKQVKENINEKLASEKEKYIEAMGEEANIEQYKNRIKPRLPYGETRNMSPMDIKVQEYKERLLEIQEKGKSIANNIADEVVFSPIKNLEKDAPEDYKHDSEYDIANETDEFKAFVKEHEEPEI